MEVDNGATEGSVLKSLDDANDVPEKTTTLSEIALLFLTLGFTSFGGPAAHIAMMHDQVVVRRKWLTDAEFVDLIGATNLIPGPNSTELAIHIGHLRAGWRGLLVAGVCFILPAVVIVLALAALYVAYGTTPQGGAIMYGIKPVIIAVVLRALIKLVPGALKSPLFWVIAGAALALFLLGVNELVVLFGGAAAMLAIHAIRKTPLLFGAALPQIAVTALITQPSESIALSLWRLFLVFFKAGALLYGSGYVLLAFLRNDLVVHLGWLTDQQLLDAIAIGQFTPGPVFTTATFIGYLLAGIPGALIATIGIFLPSFLFVGLLTRIMPYLRQSQWSAAFLDGVNATSLALMAGVTLTLGMAAFVDWQTLLIGAVAALLLFRFGMNSAWLILAGACLGWFIGQ